MACVGNRRRICANLKRIGFNGAASIRGKWGIVGINAPFLARRSIQVHSSVRCMGVRYLRFWLVWAMLGYIWRVAAGLYVMLESDWLVGAMLKYIGRAFIIYYFHRFCFVFILPCFCS